MGRHVRTKTEEIHRTSKRASEKYFGGRTG